MGALNPDVTEGDVRHSQGHWWIWRQRGRNPVAQSKLKAKVLLTSVDWESPLERWMPVFPYTEEQMAEWVWLWFKHQEELPWFQKSSVHRRWALQTTLLSHQQGYSWVLCPLRICLNESWTPGNELCAGSGLKPQPFLPLCPLLLVH